MTKVWTAETTAELVEKYETALEAAAGEVVDLTPIAEAFEVTVPSVRSKLVSMKVYQKQPVRAVGGASAVRKAHLVKQIEQATGLSVGSFEKATKADLEAMIKFLQGE